MPCSTYNQLCPVEFGGTWKDMRTRIERFNMLFLPTRRNTRSGKITEAIDREIIDRMFELAELRVE
jgi:hypothetical protein